MMKLSKKTKIHFSWLWIVYLLLFFNRAYMNLIFYIFFILCIHELAHILMACVFHYQFEKITIYPFGLSAQIKNLGYGNLIKETLIICSGPLTHALMPSFFYMLRCSGAISDPFYEYLCMINASILIFNLLPIYPLDGGRILQIFFHCVTTYKMSEKCTFFTSILVVLFLLYKGMFQAYTGSILCVFLFVELVLAWNALPFRTLQFYHFRYLHPCDEKPYLHHKKDLYRGRYNLFYRKGGWLEETSWLLEKFKPKNRH